MAAVVKAYQAYVDFLEDEQAFRKALNRIPQHRQTKALRFKFGKDQRLSVGAWLLLDYALRQEGVDVSGLPIEYGEHGKPTIARAPHFNLSHSGNSVMCVVSKECQVGCDAERLRQPHEKLVRFCMQDEEAEEILAEPDERRGLAFTRRWTLKESYMKVCGKGLSLGPKEFALTFDGRGNPFAFGDPSCSFVEYAREDGLCYAACVHDPAAEFEPMRWSVPLAKE